METCEFCQRVIIEAWTSDTDNNCDDNIRERKGGDYYCQQDCCRCLYLMKKDPKENCRCCYCTVHRKTKYDDCCSHECDHGYCYIAANEKLACHCHIAFADTCIFCVAKTGSYETYSIKHHERCMLALINTGKVHKMRGLERLEFTSPETPNLQEFYDVGYYGVEKLIKPVEF